MSMSKKAWINGLFFIVTLVVNALGAFGFINGLSQNEISDKYQTLITPDPSAFSIWSAIYILLGISIITMIVKKDDSYYQKALNKISLVFVFSSLLNIAWIIAFSYLQLVLSTVFILAFSVTLALICIKLLEINDGRHFLLPLSFGLYAGWLFIASVVNVAATLVKANWDGFGIELEILASGTLIVAVLLVFIVMLKIQNVIFPLPIAWAYFGIHKFLTSPEGFNGDFTTLQTVSLVGLVALVLISVFQLYKNHFVLIPRKGNV
ncbi:TspO and MBR related proteins [Carnobacterium iners]|uniref:TspO and MBR related proteins n=1 Tax=Carnobacterium iners TaxID=1073423 RepID=A0A1X7MXC1_9LACT|nr:TspO/MBR family protein [Carnobacterium iners]SEL21360.1 TspO and MBR related proteins [Carnobacterium iners]SMH28631.1 TspO and MBR related proteins [Carnobacterium iners]